MEDEENVSLCERILWDLDNIFKRDTVILEFDIVDVVDSVCNKSPVIYIDHHLALEKWCVPHVYDYAYKKLLNYKKTNIRIDFYLLHQWSRIILLINPDFTTAWNLRRELILNSIQSHLDDIKLTELILIRKPKCASVYSYREWLLNNYFKLKNELSENLIANELKITLDAASRYSRNYYAWSHRTWIFTFYISHSNLDYILNKIVDDLVITKNWLEAHISDYSCFQHRQYLFQYNFNLEKNFYTKFDQNYHRFDKCKEIFLKEFDLLDSLIQIYNDQESLFLHRRFLLHAASLWYPSSLDFLKNRENVFYIEKLCPLMSKYSLYSWQNQLIKRYLLYLKRNLNWTFES